MSKSLGNKYRFLNVLRQFMTKCLWIKFDFGTGLS